MYGKRLEPTLYYEAANESCVAGNSPVYARFMAKMISAIGYFRPSWRFVRLSLLHLRS